MGVINKIKKVATEDIVTTTIAITGVNVICAFINLYIAIH